MIFKLRFGSKYLFQEFKKFALLLLITISIATLNGQSNSKEYLYISFNDFLDNYVENDTAFIQNLYSNLKYPYQARKDQIQTRIEIMIIDHGIGDFEVLILNQQSTFHEVKQQLTKALKSSKIKRIKPFITRFFIYYSLDHIAFPENIKMSRLGVYYGNSINIMDYNVPTIYFHQEIINPNH